jgi:hypothetical protein
VAVPSPNMPHDAGPVPARRTVFNLVLSLNWQETAESIGIQHMHIVWHKKGV